MKKIIISFILVFFCGMYCPIKAQTYFTNYKVETTNVLKAGWYNATVYYKSSTGQKSTYTLNVQVSNDAVIAINFGNGGSVHTGYNNEGYSYSGGSLSFSQDYNGNITGASTTVQIRYSNGTVELFQIEL